MTPEGPLFHKPKSFVTAKNLLYASIFIGVLNTVLSYTTIGYAGNGGIAGIIISLVTFIIIFLLIKEMSFIKKWARTTLLVLYIVGMISFPFMLNSFLKTNMIVAALAVLQAALQLIALVFLYTKESNNWFNSRTGETLS